MDGVIVTTTGNTETFAFVLIEGARPMNVPDAAGMFSDTNSPTWTEQIAGEAVRAVSGACTETF
jgi:hypothetical protein